MVREKDEVHTYFLDQIEVYTDDSDRLHTRTRKTCNCYKIYSAIYRNAEQLVCHLAAPSSGLGKETGCTKVPPAVRDHFAKRIADKEASKKRIRSQEETNRAIERL